MNQNIDHRLKIRIYSSNTSIVLTTCKGVNSYLKLGGQFVMQRAIAAAAALYDSAKVGNCPLCPPFIDAPDM